MLLVGVRPSCPTAQCFGKGSIADEIWPVAIGMLLENSSSNSRGDFGFNGVVRSDIAGGQESLDNCSDPDSAQASASSMAAIHPEIPRTYQGFRSIFVSASTALGVASKSRSSKAELEELTSLLVLPSRERWPELVKPSSMLCCDGDIDEGYTTGPGATLRQKRGLVESSFKCLLAIASFFKFIARLCGHPSCFINDCVSHGRQSKQSTFTEKMSNICCNFCS
mmetsp:Transcript_21040/g.32786  ORF Transcript_21040/g.32786 Transcript_21040/m.32786 type:complete len:223 (-) Transcript_21040:1316-1984(-)